MSWQTQNADAMEVEDRGAPNYNAQVLHIQHSIYVLNTLYTYTFGLVTAPLDGISTTTSVHLSDFVAVSKALVLQRRLRIVVHPNDSFGS